MWVHCSSTKNCAGAARANARLSSPATWDSWPAHAVPPARKRSKGHTKRKDQAMNLMLSELHQAHAERVSGSTATSTSPWDLCPADQEGIASFRWPSEVFVLRGDDRTALCQRVQRLSDFLAQHPAMELKDLAFTLNTTLAPGGSRLAVVAESIADLRTRLERAAERLADSCCRQIKDARGIYYFAEPLYAHGRLALLFPGEGGQYLHMLGDLLPYFPEVRTHLEQCDRLSIQNGRAEPISRAFLLSQSATMEERQRAERELWRLDNAIAAILIADWSLYQLLRNLGLRPNAIASHSAGELSALTAAGCFEHNDTLIAELFALGRILRRQEDDGEMPEYVLLAVSADHSALAEILSKQGADPSSSPRAVRVAMNNCPHQTILAGLPIVM